MRHLLLLVSFSLLSAGETQAAPRADGFHQCPEEPDWQGHFVDGVQVGALKKSTGDYWAYDRYADFWTRSAVSPRLMRSPGLIGNRKGQGEGWFIGGNAVGEWEARTWLAGNPNVPDDTGKPSLTVIGPQPARELVGRDLVNDPGLRVLVPRFTTQLYDPHDPMIVASGHQRGGNPTIYVQDERGGVLMRDDTYKGPQVLQAALWRALQVNDEQRRPIPDYNPLFDPTSNALIKPQVNLSGWWTVLIVFICLPFVVCFVALLAMAGILVCFLTVALGKRLYQWAAPMPAKKRS